MTLDVARIKKDFPILDREQAGRKIVYLDSAASSQRPVQVIEAMSQYYERHHANVHRSVYDLAAEATELFEGARTKIARFIGSPTERTVLFSKNVTESINLVAYSWGRANLRSGDAVLLTELEHHANIVPWLMLEERGIELRYLPIADDHTLDLTDLDRLVDGVKLVSFAAMSNVLGTLTPIGQLVDAAHRAGAIVLVDAAQYVPHLPTDVVDLGADLFAFTGHKMLGPTGIGVLWGREELLDEMPAFLGGGEMILDVRLDGWTPNTLPHKFEAGTPPIAEAIGLGAAVDYLEELGMEAVREHEVSLTGYALRCLTERLGERLTIHGPAEPDDRGGVLSLALEGVHAHDVSQILNEHGVCVRASHHCAKPLMRRLGVGATARASLYLYNDESDVEALADGLEHAADFFGP